jgi:DNA polymerase III delta subunit
VVWDLTSGIATRRAGPALDALHRLLEDGEAPHKLLALILWQMRLVLRMAEMVRQGRSDEEIRGELRLRGEVFTALKREMERSFPGAAALLGRLAEANRQMNSSRAGDRRALELLVLELCQRG